MSVWDSKLHETSFAVGSIVSQIEQNLQAIDVRLTQRPRAM